MSSNRIIIALGALLAMTGPARGEEPVPPAPPADPPPDPSVLNEPPPAPPVTPTEPAPQPPPPDPVTTEPVYVAAPAEPEPREAPTFWPAPDRRNWFGIEVGMMRTADMREQYSEGLGRGVVLGIKGWELRLGERYDVSTMGRVSIGSFGRRIDFGTGLVRARALVGAAWLRRAVEGIPASTSGVFYSQHGLGAMLGAGVQLGLLTAELRAYPTLWQGEPGGIPVTLTAGIGISF